MICAACGAEILEGAEKCSKCSGTVFSGAKDARALRRVIQFFSVAPFYVKASPPHVVNGELEAVPIEWKLYRTRTQPNAPSIFLLDRDGYVTPSRPEATLHLIEGEDLSKMVAETPDKKLGEIQRILKDEWGVLPSEDGTILEMLSQVPVLYEPVPRLRDPEAILTKTNWRDYVEKLACWKPGKDPVLVKSHTAKLVKPLTMKYASHSIECTNAGTGKSSFYNAAGILVDKATPKALLGFARSPEEIYPGTVNGSELPIAFDQLESQTAYALGRYLFNILETGSALIDAGGVRFPVSSHSTFTYLANPIAKDAKAAEGFSALLDHLTVNTAMGRRFGIVIFRTDLASIKGAAKMSVSEEEAWRTELTFFRAVEEYAKPKLKSLIREQRIIDWLHSPIPKYRETVLKAIKNLEDDKIRGFFEAHVEGEHRVRGAAFHAALALLLDKVALDETSIDEILEEAEERLEDYVAINTESIGRLCEMWSTLKVDCVHNYFERLSDYMKEIVSAVLKYRDSKPDSVTVHLDNIPYEPQDDETYKYFSRCISRLRKRRNLDSLNEKLRNYFGFQIGQKDGSFMVQYFEDIHIPKDLPLIGFIRLSDLSIYPNLETPITLEDGTKKASQEKIGRSQNADKRIKGINGYSQEGAPDSKASEPIVSDLLVRETSQLEQRDKALFSPTCGSCEFHRLPSKCPEEHAELIQPAATYAQSCKNYRRRHEP